MIIDFLVLPNKDDSSYFQFISTQVRSYYEMGNTVVIYAEDAVCQILDALLWFDGEDCFLPHAYIMHESQECNGLPVVLASNADFLKSIKKEKLIDLTIDEMPVSNASKHLVKIVDQEPVRLQASRRYYKALQQQGFMINVQKI